jgi:hypothetical protein
VGVAASAQCADGWVVTRLNGVSVALTFSILLIAGVLLIGVAALVFLVRALHRGSTARRG